MEKKIRSVLPYSCIVGQGNLKLALELAYISPRIGGVLITGKRGTAKSTTARAFATMMYRTLPVTIPINATEDRVVGGWDIPKLLVGDPDEQYGLLKQANGNLLYIDEVNLLDDHIVNIILDVTSTGKLVVQREGLDKQYDVQFTLVGTMNPEEGSLRPQLLDRFGLVATVEALINREQRLQILDHVLKFDQALQEEQADGTSAWLDQCWEETYNLAAEIVDAKKRFPKVALQTRAREACVDLAIAFDVEGHRGDHLLALTACAYAARLGDDIATTEHLAAISELVLRHRYTQGEQGEHAAWGEKQQAQVQELLY